MVTILTETDNSIGALQQYITQEYLGYSVEEIKGKNILVIKSTTKLTTKEFSDDLTQVDAFAVGEGVILPNDDLYYDSMGIKG